MLTRRNNTYKQNGLFDLPDSDELADIINHNIVQLKLMEMAEITHNYDCNFIEEVFNKIESIADIDRFIGIIKIHWQIDVYNRRELVVKYDTNARDYVPYVPDLDKRLDTIRDKIEHKRELEEQLERQWSEWEVERLSVTTKTEAPRFGSSSPEVKFEVCLKIEDLDSNVQCILNITNDQDFEEFVDICRNEIWPWLHNEKHKKFRPRKDANVVRFAFRYYGIVDKDCSVRNFVLLFNAIVPEAELIDDTVSSRDDANMKSRDFYKYDSLPNYNNLKKDTEQLRKMLKPVIDKLV